jgi:translocation and assembly module TamB
MSRVVKLGLLLLFWLGALFLFGAGLLLGSAGGTRLLLQEIRDLSGGRFRYQSVQGKLLDRLVLQGMHLAIGGRNNSVQRLTLSWHPGALLQGRLDIVDLTLSGARLDLPPGEEEAASPSLQAPHIPLDLRLTHLLVEDLELKLGHAAPLRVERLLVRAELAEGRLGVRLLELEAEGTRLRVQGSGNLLPPYPVQASLDWRWEPPAGAELAGRLELEGDAQRLAIRNRSTDELPLELEAVAHSLLQEPRWEARLEWPEFPVPDWIGVPGLVLTPGGLRSSGTAQAYKLKVIAGHRGAGLPAASWSLAGSGDSTGLVIAALSGELLQGRLEGSGRVDWTPEPAARLALDFSGLSPAALAARLPPRLDGRAQLSARLSGKTLQIHTLALDLEPAGPHLELTGRLATEGLDLDASLSWRDLSWPLPPAQARVISPSGSLELVGRPDAYRARLQSSLHTPELGPTRWRLQATGDTRRLRIEQLAGELLDGTLEGGGELGWVPRPKADLTLEGRDIRPGPLIPDWPAGASAGLSGRLIWEDRRLRIPEMVVRLAPGDTLLSLEGEAGLEPDPLDSPFQACIRWQDLRWPPAPAAALVRSDRGEANLEGKLASYRVALDAGLVGPGLPAGRWRLEAEGTPSALQPVSLNGELLNGQVEARGTLAWSPLPRWDLSLDISGLDPAGLLPDWPGDLHGCLDTDGTLSPSAGLAGRIQVRRLEGNLKHLPLNLSGSARVRGGDYWLEGVILTSGANRLDLAGGLRDGRLALDWKAEVPQLASLLATATGVLEGQGQIRGSPDKPLFQAQIGGRELALEAYRLERLEARLKLGLETDGPLELALQARGPSGTGPWPLDSLALSAHGTLDQHALDVDLETPGGTLAARLEGAMGLDEALWRGRLQRLEGKTREAGHWHLKRAADLELGARRARLDGLCLLQSGGASRLCADGTWGADRGTSLKARLEGLPLALLEPAVSGTLSADLRSARAPDGTLEVSTRVSLAPGLIRVPVGDLQRSFPHRGGELSLDVDATGLRAELALRPLQHGLVGASLELPGLRRPTLPDGQPIAGKLQLDLPDLAPLQAFVPQLANTSGRLAGDLRLSGSLPLPRFQGSAGLKEASTDLPLAGLALRDIGLELASDPQRPQRLVLSGGVSSGQGRLTLSGSGDLETGHAELHLQGRDVQVVNTPDARAVAAPDLTLVWNGQVMALRGRVLLPHADITPQLGLGGASDRGADASGVAVTPSRDVVVVRPQRDGGATPAPAPPPLPLDSDLELLLGDEVRIDSLGFKSRVGGRLRLINRPGQRDRVPRARGALNILDGTFRSFGQDLEIEWGRIAFDGQPVTEPELDIRAVRWIQGDERIQAAGLHISGSLEHSRLELFSRPQIDEESIQAYLLTGRGPDSAERTLNLGTQLSSDLYVGYGINLLEGTHEFNLRYDILRHFGLETDVGEADKSISFSYILER